MTRPPSTAVDRDVRPEAPGAAVGGEAVGVDLPGVVPAGRAEQHDQQHHDHDERDDQPAQPAPAAPRRGRVGAGAVPVATGAP